MILRVLHTNPRLRKSSPRYLYECTFAWYPQRLEAPAHPPPRTYLPQDKHFSTTLQISAPFSTFRHPDRSSQSPHHSTTPSLPRQPPHHTATSHRSHLTGHVNHHITLPRQPCHVNRHITLQRRAATSHLPRLPASSVLLAFRPFYYSAYIW